MSKTSVTIPKNTGEASIIDTQIDVSPKTSPRPSAVSNEAEADRGLASCGYQSELRREYTFFSAFSFAVSISGLMATIGTTFLYPLIAGGAASAVWGWAVAGIGCLSVAFSVAEIVSSYPTSGGLYFACSKLFPEQYAPFMCWIDGWINLLGQVAGVASSDYGAAQMLLAAIEIGTDFSYTPDPKHAVAVSIGILVLHGAINSFPTKYLERLTNTYVVLHFICLVAGCICLLVKTEDKNTAKYVFTHVESSSGWQPLGFSFLFSFLSVSWTMTDYAAVASLSEELKNPAMQAPWAIFLAMIFTYIVGIAYNIVLCFCMGDASRILDANQPVAMIYWHSLGKAGGIVFTLTMFMVMNFVGITALCATSRTTWAQARDKMLPFSSVWYRVNKYTKTPLYAVWMNSICCMLLNLIALGSTTTINAIFNVTAIALDWSYVIPIIGKILFPRLFSRGPWNMGKLSIFVNWYATLWTLFASIIFFLPTNMPVTRENMNYASVIFVSIVAFAISYWYLGGNNKYRGPQPTAPDPAVAENVDLRGEVKDEKLE